MTIDTILQKCTIPTCYNTLPKHELMTLAGLILCPSCYAREKSLLDLASNPPETVIPALTLEELYTQATKDEQLKLSSLDLDTSDGQAKLIARIQQLESIAYEMKARSVIAHKARRKYETEHGIGQWNKERGPENRLNSSDPKSNKFIKTVKERHKVELTKVEKSVQGFLDLEYSDTDIIEMLTAGGKFKGIEIREAIEKLKK